MHRIKFVALAAIVVAVSFGVWFTFPFIWGSGKPTFCAELAANVPLDLIEAERHLVKLTECEQGTAAAAALATRLVDVRDELIETLEQQDPCADLAPVASLDGDDLKLAEADRQYSACVEINEAQVNAAIRRTLIETQRSPRTNAGRLHTDQ